ncbi:alpha/beta hydrolase [Micromonospora sp. NBC_01412]|uniref:alpha/beta hydrolase n=1 Tax=Micromonospora sp. NBC_01412 TaxID=2903590 RepID=UPI003252C2AF
MGIVRTMRAVLIGATAVVMGVVGTASAASAGGGGAASTCVNGSATVPIGLLSMATMAGRLCTPAGGADTVVVLVPGATYTGVYWDFTYQPGTYSQVRSLLSAGFATYTVDRIGTGASSKPLAALVTVNKQAKAVNASIQKLRAGAIGGVAFDRVVLMGHSLGSLISMEAAATYGGLDGLVVTGMTHSVNFLLVGEFLLSFTSAPLDPAFAPSGLDPLYLTTQPGVRGGLFHSASDPVPAVVAEDEATKSVLATGELTEGVIRMVLSKSPAITAPVLVSMGAEDKLFCGMVTSVCGSSAALLAAEAPHFPNAASLSADVTPVAGHDLTLARNTGDYQAAVAAWIAANV